MAFAITPLKVHALNDTDKNVFVMNSATLATVRWPVGLDINYIGAESNLAHQAEEPIHHQPAGRAAYAALATHRVVRRYRPK